MADSWASCWSAVRGGKRGEGGGADAADADADDDDDEPALLLANRDAEAGATALAAATAPKGPCPRLPARVECGGAADMEDDALVTAEEADAPDAGGRPRAVPRAITAARRISSGRRARDSLRGVAPSPPE